MWRIADEAGFDTCWVFDHFASIGSGGPGGDVLEGWTLLAAMAEATRRVRIGVMVTGLTYRHPAVLAKMAVTVDHLSGGRLEMGVGAAWAEGEHTMLGLEFPTTGERMRRLDEACRLMKTLWTEPRATFRGRYFRLEDAIAEPKPVQKPHPPIWIGGKGERKLLRIVAKHAAVWNCSDRDAEESARLSKVLDEHCAAVGRDPSTIRRSVQLFFTGDVGPLFGAVRSFAKQGFTDLVVIVGGADAVSHAHTVAEALPKLRAL